MERNIWSDGRQNDRIGDTIALSDKREGVRRTRNRRKLARLAYPPSAEPKVLNGNFHVADMSQKGIKFLCRDNCEECTDPVTLNSIVDLRIQFHDGETVDIKVEILRCERTLDSQEKTYAGFVANGISAGRMAKEQAFLLKHFPEFGRVSRE
jgi:hypothetical protein